MIISNTALSSQAVLIPFPAELPHPSTRLSHEPQDPKDGGCAFGLSPPTFYSLPQGEGEKVGFVLGFHTPASVSQPVFPKSRCKVWGAWVSSQHGSVESRLWTTRSFKLPCLLPAPSSAHALLQILSPIPGSTPPRRYPLASESRTKTPKGGLQAGAASSGAVESEAPCPSPSCRVGFGQTGITIMPGPAPGTGNSCPARPALQGSAGVFRGSRR